jgi:hypothetical protein
MRLKASKTAGNDLELLPHGVETIGVFFGAKVTKVVGAEFAARKAGGSFHFPGVDAHPLKA